MTVARKISITFLGGALLLVAAGAGVHYVVGKRVVEDNARAGLAAEARSRAMHVGAFIEEHRCFLASVAAHEALAGYLRSGKRPDGPVDPRPSAESLLAELVRIDRHVLRMSLANGAGTVVLSSDKSAIGSHRSLACVSAGAAIGAAIPVVTFDEALGEHVFSMSAPVLFEGRLAGTVLADLSMDDLWAIVLDREELGDTGEACLADAEGLLVSPSRSGDGNVMTRRVDAVWEVPASGHETGERVETPGVRRFVDSRGIDVLCARASVPGTDWFLFVTIGEKEAMAPLRNIRNLSLSLVALVPLIAWLLGRQVGRAVSGPIKELCRVAETIGAGNLNHRVGLTSNDEIGELGRAIDDMAGNLNKATATIDDLQDEVRRRVDAETALRDSEQKYRSLVDNIGIGISLISPEMRVLSLNRQMEKWFPDVDLSTKPFCYEVFNYPPKREICANCPTQMTLEDARVHEAILDVNTPTGSRYVRIVSSPIIDEDGRVKAAIAAIEDVTEIVRANDALAERIEYERLISSVSSGLIKPRTGEVDEAMEQGLREVAEFFGADRAAISMIDPETGKTEVAHVWLSEGFQQAANVASGWKRGQMPDLLTLLKKGEGFVFRKAEETPADSKKEREYAAVAGVKSAAVVPLSVGGRFLGLMALDSLSEINWPPGVVERLNFIGMVLMNAINRKATDQDLAARAEALKESSARLETILESSPNPIALADLKGNLVECNGATFRTLGCRTKEDVIGRSLFSFIDPCDVERLKRDMEEALERGTYMNREYTFIGADGRRFPGEISAGVIRTATGEPAGYVGVASDISDRKRVELALRESEEKYRLLVENQTDLVVKVDVQGRFLFVSPSYCRTFGQKEKDLLGKAFMPLVHEEDRESTAKAMEDLYRPPHRCYVEQRALTKDGWHWLAWADSSILDSDEKVVAVVGVGRDITARKEAEEALLREKNRAQSYLDVARVMMLALDAEGKVTLMNRAGCELLGFEEHEIMGKDWCDLAIPAGLSEKMRGRYRALMAGEADVPDYIESPVLTMLGEKRLIAWRSTLLRGRSGEVTGVLSSGEDITDRKQTEHEMVRLERLRAVGEMAAGISHNLNNILVGVLGHAQLLRFCAVDKEALAEIEHVISAARRAEDLVERLRCAVSADVEGDLEAVSLSEVLSEAILETRPRWKDEPEARGTPMTLSCNVDDIPDVRATCSGLHDVLVNLILNAVDAMPEGGTLSFDAFSRDDGVEIEAKDTGVGMDEETRRRVFEPFFTTKAEVGTGLGLSTVYASVSSWGGNISVKSAREAGTVFRIWLQAWDGPRPAREERVAPAVEALETPGGRILIVEDEETVISVLTGLLSSDHEVTVAGDADEALRVFKPGRYDVALIDLGLPGRPGNELNEALKAIDPLLVTVLVTGWRIRSGDPRLAGFDFRLEKPFGDLVEVERVVSQAVARRSREAPAPAPADSGKA